MEKTMTMPVSRSATSLNPEGFGQLATAPSRKESLAIVSTSNRLCGIAAYTAALQRQLSDVFDITVFDLDQYLLRSPHRRVRKLADRHIKEICDAKTVMSKTSDRKSTRLNSSHANISYAVFCLKKKK